MDVPRWPRPDRVLLRCLRPEPERSSEIDPAQWVEMANGEAVDPVPIEDDPASFERLTKELLDVLSDESATMIPPSAGGMDRAEWSRLSPRERAGYGRRQLRSLDPRLLPRAVLRWSSRRYSHSPH